eukprot:Hpha_TRINITY_DN16720_c2_g10::TRINITY_DN16720_c2_g10_i1::g.79687::m.79687/K03514/PAPD5_7, TRF4; non-canonical poly(A) RNA polymerase PAPD5/7
MPWVQHRSSPLPHPRHGRQPNQPQAVVCTPWIPEGRERSALTLSEEVQRVAELVHLTPLEGQERVDTLSRVTTAVAQVFGPKAVVISYGSYASGLSGASSALDVSIAHCGTLTREAVEKVAKGIGKVQSLLAEGFAQVEADSGLLVNVTFSSGEDVTGAAASTSTVASWLQQYPEVRDVHAVLRQVLSQTGNLDVSTGGISAYCLLAIIVACARRRSYSDCGELLAECCRLFGEQFSFKTEAVDPRSAAACSRPPSSDALWVCDPVTEGNNLAAGCTRLFAVKALLQHCASALTRWESTAGRRKGYKGKTPLSSILSHQALRSRVEVVKRAKELLEEEEEDCLPPLMDDGDSESEQGVEELSSILSTRGTDGPSPSSSTTTSPQPLPSNLDMSVRA